MTALRKLLVVDDDPVVGASFKRVLSGKGYLVVSAENGSEALARLQAEKFDAVFTDLRMPGMDGLQVAERVRAAQPWMPVMIVTGYGSPASEARARAAGVSGFLHKPLSPEMIEDSAAKAVQTVLHSIEPPRVELVHAAAIETAPVAAAPAAEPQPTGGALRVLKNMALFLAAPFIGLLYAVLLPFVGLGMLVYVALKKPDQVEPDAAQPAAAPIEPVAAPVVQAPVVAIAESAAEAALESETQRSGLLGALKFAAGLAAAPFIALAWILAAPFVGLAALAWLGMKAAYTRIV
jgi:CheY-like chemotaxis protein